MLLNTPSRFALQSPWRPTTASADFSLRLTPSLFQAQGEISPGKNALRCRTTAGSTPPTFGQESFVAIGPLALFGKAFYPVLVHRPAAVLRASSPHSVAPVQLRFARHDLLATELATVRVRSFWAHQTREPLILRGLLKERTGVSQCKEINTLRGVRRRTRCGKSRSSSDSTMWT